MERIRKEGITRWSLRQVPEVQGAFLAMDVRTGRVLAMQGGFSFQASPYNRATQARRQPGSAIKPVVYAAALDHGYTPVTLVLDARWSWAGGRPRQMAAGEFQRPVWRPDPAASRA